LQQQKEELVNLRAGASRKPQGEDIESERKVQAIDARDSFDFE
jgi:hypothetical protein